MFSPEVRLWQIPEQGKMLTVISIGLALAAIDAALLIAGAEDQFQRFGSVIITVGVIGVAMSRRAITLAEEMNEDWEERGGAAVGQREAEALHYVFFSRTLPAAEFGAIAIGTMQSGYGDYLVRWLL